MKKAIVLTSLFVLSGCGVRTVDAGYVGIETEFGKVVGDSLEPGLHFYNPFTSSILKMDTRTQLWNEKTEAYTKDIQTATIDFSVNYNLEAKVAGDTYRNVGQDWQDKLLPQVVYATIKNVTGQWDAVELIANRQKATSAIETQLTAAMSAHGVTITRFEIKDINFTAEFNKAVEAKVIATQQAAQAENQTKQIEEQAKQKVITAEAEAKSMKIRSDALSQNANLVQYEAVQKWDGKLPEYMAASTPLPFLSMDKK